MFRVCLMGRTTSKRSILFMSTDPGGRSIPLSFALYLVPFVHFHGLTSVVIAISFSSEERYSLGVRPSFVKHVAPSVEIPHLSVIEVGYFGSIPVDMSEILCDDALMMPNIQ